MLTIAHLSTIYHTSFILMGTDWLEREGITAEWKLFASGPDIVDAFERGDIDIAYIGLPPAIIGIDRGIEIICVAGGHVEGTVLIAGKQYSTLEEVGDIPSTLAQFEGKTIGSPPKGSIHDVIINNIINKYHMNINVKNFAWTDFVLEALVDGDIQAAVGTPSLAVAAAQACDAKIILPPPSLCPNNPSYGIVIRKGLSPDIIVRFLRQHERACNFIRTNPEKSASMVSRLVKVVDKDFVIRAYNISPRYCADLSKEFVNSTMAFVSVLRRLGYISRNLSEGEIFEYRFIREVHKQPPHY